MVDYMGVGADLKQALMDYTASGGEGRTFHDQEEAVAKLQEKYEVVRDMFHGFDYKKFFGLKPGERVSFIPQAMEHILKESDKKERFQRETGALLKAFALAVPDARAMKIKKEVGLFQAVKSAITKTAGPGAVVEERFDAGIKQILSKALISDRIIDIFEAVGLQKPDVSVLSEAFLAEVKNMPQKNLAFEALKKLLNDEIRFYSSDCLHENMTHHGLVQIHNVKRWGVESGQKHVSDNQYPCFMIFILEVVTYPLPPQLVPDVFLPLLRV